ncbi:hypothetical protein M9Y10_022688 [Tritrichomonas musculus]|uniref:DUF2428 domain-containing protein n=1 Tax=Tritrichomonas musculus TaxID=1915356 RepID=A0ABR2KT68_9EUKA
MEEIINKINELSKSKNLVPAEQVMMTTVHEIDPYLSLSISDDLALKLFDALVSLFHVNKGEFSFQCSIYIASKIVRLFELNKEPKFWDIINMSIECATPSAIIAAGYICRKVGSHYKSQIPRFIEYCLKIDPPNYATLHAMRDALKAGEKTVWQFGLPIYELLKKTISNAKANLIMLYLKLLRTLLNIPPITPTQILDCMQLVMKYREQPFIKNELAHVVARCAYHPFSTIDLNKQFETNEWSIGVLKMETRTLNLEPAFQILSKFPSILSHSFIHFLNLLGPEMISMNHTNLFNYIRSKCPDVVKHLIPMLPADLRFSYFRSVSTEPMSAEQLKTLTILCPDDGSIDEAAGVALLLATSDDKNSRHISIEYFSELANTHPQIVLPYLHSSLVLLAQPPERNPRILRDLKGNASVALAILRNLSDTQAAVMQNKTILQKLLAEVYSKPRATSYRFIFSFALLSCLPPEEFSEFSEQATKAVDFSISYFLKKDSSKPPKMTRSLLKSVFNYRAKFPNEEQNKQLLDVAVSFPSPLPFSVISDLCQIIQKSPLVFTGTKLVLDFALSVQTSPELISKYIKRPLPTAKDLMCSRIYPSSQQKKNDEFLTRFIDNFPLLINSCSNDDQKKLVTQLLKTISTTSLLILTCISQNTSILPPKFTSILLQHLENKNTLIVQLLSECIAKYLTVDPQSFPEVFNRASNGQNISNCILLSSLFMHVNLPINYVNQSFIIIDSLILNRKTTAYSIHALSSLLLTHQMQLTSLSVASNQFNVLFQAINTPSSLQPVTLHIMSECYGCLIEAFSSDMSNKFRLIVELILRSIEATPMDYAREVYFESSQAIFTFANSMSYLAPLSFPQSRSAPSSLQLTSCAAFSDFLKFQSSNDVLNIDINELVPRLLSLLQRTDDERASNFIIALASLMKEQDITFWISTIKRILISCSLLDRSNFTIEPTPIVKLACLKVATFIVPHIASEFKLNTEHLDDLISSVCRATETDRVKLQEAAFPTLDKVIILFKDRKSEEGQRLLDLYDSQFSMAVKVGFKVNLAVSGGFLINYLTFNTDNMENDPENCSAILVTYLGGLNDCPQRTESYFSIATHLCTIARKYPPLRDLINPFLKTLTPIFFDLVTQDMQLWNPSSDWRSLSRFRSLAQSFYSELLPAFVWLQKTTNTNSVDIDVLVSFILIELKDGKEGWINKSAFESLPVAIQAFGAKISPELLNLSIRGAMTYYNKNHKQTSSKTKRKSSGSSSNLNEAFNDFPDFNDNNNYHRKSKNSDENDNLAVTFMNLILVATKIITKDVRYDEVRKNLLSMAVNNLPIFSSKIFAYLLKKDERRILTPYATTIFQHFMQHCEEEEQSYLIALIVLLFTHSPSVINSCISNIIENESNYSTELAIEILKRGLLLSEKGSKIPLELITRFCIKNFKKGAMHMIGLIIVEREEIGLALLAEGAAKAAFLLSTVEKGNCRAYLRFIQLALNTIEKNYSNQEIGLKFAQSASLLALSVASKFGKDMSRHGHQILLQCISILKDSKEMLNAQNKFESAFMSVDEDERKNAITNIVFHIRSEEQRKKADQLVAFSTNDRGKKQMEWQTLEIEGEDE